MKAKGSNMVELTDKYNDKSDRRKQSLPFVGQDRRKIIQNARDEREEAIRTRAFLHGASNIENVQRLA